VDEVDEKIISVLEKDSRTPFTEIAKSLDLSDVAVKKRVEKLLASGILKRFSVELDQEKMGKPVRAYVLLRCSPENTDKIVSDLRDKVKVERTIGSYDLLLSVDFEDIQALRNFVEDDLGAIMGIAEIRTLIRV